LIQTLTRIHYFAALSVTNERAQILSALMRGADPWLLAEIVDFLVLVSTPSNATDVEALTQVCATILQPSVLTKCLSLKASSGPQTRFLELLRHAAAWDKDCQLLRIIQQQIQDMDPDISSSTHLHEIRAFLETHLS
jgi:hypothetical protein